RPAAPRAPRPLERPHAPAVRADLPLIRNPQERRRNGETAMRRHTQAGAKMLPRWRRLVLALPLVALTAGLAEPTRPAVPGDNGSNDGASRTPSRVLGLVEVTISGLGTGQMRSSAISAATVEELDRLRAMHDAAGDSAAGIGAGATDPGARFAFSRPSNSDETGDGTIQLELVSTGSFADGDRKNGGYRYLFATYRVRNAQADSTPYNTPRQNLTFYAVKTSKSKGHTAISQLRHFDGSDADEALAAQLIPTGAVARNLAGEIVSLGPDVLQVIAEDEAAEILGLANGAGRAID